jgi:hypothetical protein
MLGNIPDICSSDQSSSFTCPNGRTVFSSSVIWGLIGPDRLYSVGKRYSSLLHFFWIGALTPVVTWYAYKKTGKKIFKDINWPLFFVGTYNVPPATGKFGVLCVCRRREILILCTGINYTSWALVNWIFNGYIKKNFFAWWTKYNVRIPAFSSCSTQQLTKKSVCSSCSSRYRNSCCRYCHLLCSQLSRLLDAGLVGYDGVCEHA